MLLRTAEELLLTEYEILLVVLVVKFLAYEYCHRNEEYWWIKAGLNKWEWGLTNRPY